MGRPPVSVLYLKVHSSAFVCCATSAETGGGGSPRRKNAQRAGCVVSGAAAANSLQTDERDGKREIERENDGRRVPEYPQCAAIKEKREC